MGKGKRHTTNGVQMLPRSQVKRQPDLEHFALVYRADDRVNWMSGIQRGWQLALDDPPNIRKRI